MAPAAAATPSVPAGGADRHGYVRRHGPATERTVSVARLCGAGAVGAAAGGGLRSKEYSLARKS